jgi:hypothetical protein
MDKSIEWSSRRIGIRLTFVSNIYIYINKLDDSVYSKVLKFADDTKHFSVVSNANDIDKL